MPPQRLRLLSLFRSPGTAPAFAGDNLAWKDAALRPSVVRPTCVQGAVVAISIGKTLGSVHRLRVMNVIQRFRHRVAFVDPRQVFRTDRCRSEADGHGGSCGTRGLDEPAATNAFQSSAARLPSVRFRIFAHACYSSLKEGRRISPARKKQMTVDLGGEERPLSARLAVPGEVAKPWTNDSEIGRSVNVLSI